MDYEACPLRCVRPHWGSCRPIWGGCFGKFIGIWFNGGARAASSPDTHVLSGAPLFGPVEPDYVFAEGPFGSTGRVFHIQFKRYATAYDRNDRKRNWR